MEKFLTSDEFTRQDEVLALFHKGECSALCFFEWVDASEGPVRHNPNFEPWPEVAFSMLCDQGSRLLVCSQFTVQSDYRNNSSDIPWKDLVMALLVERFRHSERDAMTGAMRLTKNMGEATYRTGAVPLVKGMTYSGENDPVDLVAFYQDKVTDSAVSGIPELVKMIFPKTIALAKPIIKFSKCEIKRVA